MRGLKHKSGQKWKRVMILILLLLVLGFMINSLHNVYNKKNEAQQVLMRMQQEVQNLKNRKLVLQNSIQNLDTPDGLGLEIRRKLDVAGVGERVAVIVEELTPISAPSTEPSLWQKVKNFVIKWFR